MKVFIVCMADKADEDVPIFIKACATREIAEELIENIPIKLAPSCEYEILEEEVIT